MYLSNYLDSSCSIASLNSVGLLCYSHWNLLFIWDWGQAEVKESAERWLWNCNTWRRMLLWCVECKTFSSVSQGCRWSSGGPQAHSSKHSCIKVITKHLRQGVCCKDIFVLQKFVQYKHAWLPFSLNHKLMQSATYCRWKSHSLSILQQQSEKLIW